jgi:hypothetical protein
MDFLVFKSTNLPNLAHPMVIPKFVKILQFRRDQIHTHNEQAILNSNEKENKNNNNYTQI